MRSLRSILATLSLLFHFAFANLNVTSWSSPSSGDLFESGQTIHTAFHSSGVPHSPGFRLCVFHQPNNTSENDSEEEQDGLQCGTTIHPNVTRDGDLYSADMLAPNVSEIIECYLTVSDKTGNTATSQTFLLSPVKPVRAKSLAYVPFTDESDPSLPSRIIIYAIPLAFVGLTLLIGITVYLHRRRRFQQAASEQLAAQRDRDHCNDDKCGDPITCAHTRSDSYNEKRSSARRSDIYTSYYPRSLPHQYPRLSPNQPRQATKEPFRPRPRRSTVPARLFKDPKDTTSVASADDSSSEQSIPAAMTYDEIAAQHLHPPSTSSNNVAVEAITPPKKLHTRRAANASQIPVRRPAHGYSGSI